MKILVFDDSATHRQSAALTLKGHDVVIVGTYDEAQGALVPKLDHAKTEKYLPDFLKEAGLPAGFNPYHDTKATPADKKKYADAYKKATDRATMRHNFDVVLTDLLVPASRQAQGPQGEEMVGKEMPLGATIALLAIAVGVKKVAVVTDMNHHNHPASAAFDCFGEICKPGANLICTNRVGSVSIDEVTGTIVDEKFLESEAGKKKYPYPEGKSWGDRKGLADGKDWGMILKQLFG